MKKIILSAFLLGSPGFAQQPEIPECKIPMPSDLSAGNAAVKKMRDECLPKIKRIAECVSRTRLLSEAVSAFIGKFRRPAGNVPLLVAASADIEHFDLKSSDLNIWRNFLSLETQYNQSLDVVKNLANKYRTIQTAGAASTMRSQLEILDHDYNEAAKAIARLSENEYKLLIFIENVQRDLAESYNRTKDEALWLVGDECKDANVAPAVKKIESAFIVFSEDVNLIYRHIMSAKSARQNLINYTYTAIRAKIEDAYSARLVDELSTLGGKIDTILRANRLSAKFENWYSWTAFEPNRDKVLSVYQQFEAARQILAADLISAQNFKEQMLVAIEPFPDTGEYYLNRMDSVINEIEARLQRLETKGWQGFLSSQKATANRIVATPEKLTSACLAAYNDFLEQASSVDTLENYRVSEKRYMSTVITCTRKPS
ncbi:MAG TPA: hypothetical protein VFO10_02785 [Oligoflexus sp.]|uniref:hypothetical protein n=1 Tax=Oligoflexus sp. TaxID=1971216 RepID=UPI002D802031|nr:hypothetical protein [Oligoflexus sp.]HET9236148.1 hypothetical protein [Oligoflexus sp.]